MRPIKEAADLKGKKLPRALWLGARGEIAALDGKLQRRAVERSECDQRLNKCFGERAAEKDADQVAFIIRAAFEIVDGVGGLGQRFGCVIQSSFDL